MLPPECCVCGDRVPATEEFRLEIANAPAGTALPGADRSHVWVCDAHRPELIHKQRAAIDGRLLWRAVVDYLRVRVYSIEKCLAVEESRSWHPMDGALPPYCPFVDEITVRATQTGSVIMRVSQAHWNDDNISSIEISVDAHHAGETLRLRAFGQGAMISSLEVSGTLKQEAEAKIEALFAVPTSDKL